METATLSEASVYVGTYGKYNNGSLFGAWLDLSDYADKEEFYEACRELHKDEEDADDLVRDFQDEYQGQYDDEEDFAYQIVEECYDLPEFAKTYFDYKQFARDLFMCDYWFDDGFVFRAA